MGKIFTKIIDRFDGGTAKDVYSKNSNQFALARNFDAFSYPHKLAPTAGLVESSGTYKSKYIKKIFYGERSSGTFKVFGLGGVPGVSVPTYYYYDSGWQEPANNAAASGANIVDQLNFTYKGFAYCYGTNGASGGDLALKRFDLDSVTAFEDDVVVNVFSASGIYITNFAHPLIHPSDDCAYFFGDNIVYRLNNVTWNGAVLTLPSDLRIVSACPYGNYLAIACTNNVGDTSSLDKKSVVFLWDRDSSLATLTERIDFGTGEIIHLVNLNNKLIALMKNFPYITVKQKSGNFAVTINELVSDGTDFGTQFTIKTNQILNNVLYFPMDLDGDAGDRFGVWALDSNGRLNLELGMASAAIYNGIFNTGNVWWVSYKTDGSVFYTSSSGAALTLVYKSVVMGDGSQEYKLLSVGVLTEPLVSTGDYVQVDYRVKETDSWTTIFQKGTGYDVLTEAVNIEYGGAGTELPEFRNIFFKVTLSKADTFKGLVIKYEELNSNLSD